MKVHFVVEAEVPENEMNILHAIDGGFEVPLKDRLMGHSVAIKSGPYENAVWGNIVSVSLEKEVLH